MTTPVHVSELCLRCGAEMAWVHQTWQCPRCRFKLGCCEGEGPSCGEGGPARPCPERGGGEVVAR